MEESAVEFEGDEVSEEEMVTQFKQFLETVSPEEFAIDPEGEVDEDDEDEPLS